MVYIVALLTLLADQGTKYWAVNALTKHEFVQVFPFFNLFLTYNKGVSFSIFSTDTTYGPWVLAAGCACVCLGVLWWLLREKDVVVRYALALVLGGAVGNILDRVRLGSVVDFLDFHYDIYHWPAFNVADTAICCGAALIFMRLFFQKREEK